MSTIDARRVAAVAATHAAALDQGTWRRMLELGSDAQAADPGQRAG